MPKSQSFSRVILLFLILVLFFLKVHTLDRHLFSIHTSMAQNKLRIFHRAFLIISVFKIK